ncbi:hypothetical protein G6F66_014792 [Rhizopus arrhizus]|nr:hypothetical protein G6F66_014792 [Rhizopus arrhizus]
MSSLNQDNQAISGALTGESQQGNKMMRYVNEPKSFSGYAKYPGGDVCSEAYAWLNRMSRLKATAKLSDKEILFIVGVMYPSFITRYENSINKLYVKYIQ